MPVIETPDTADETWRPLLRPVAPDRVAHLPTPTPEPDDDEDDNEDDDRGSGGGNIDPDDDEGGSDDDDDEDDTLWADRRRAAPRVARG